MFPLPELLVFQCISWQGDSCLNASLSSSQFLCVTCCTECHHYASSVENTEQKTVKMPILKEDAKRMSNIYKLFQMANMLFWGACEQAGYVAILSSISMEDVRKLFPWESLPHWVGFSEHDEVKFPHFLVILLWCNVLSSGICLEYVEGERNLIIACLPWARGACSPEVELSYFLIGESWVSKSVFPWWIILADTLVEPATCEGVAILQWGLLLSCHLCYSVLATYKR